MILTRSGRTRRSRDMSATSPWRWVTTVACRWATGATAASAATLRSAAFSGIGTGRAPNSRVAARAAGQSTPLTSTSSPGPTPDACRATSTANVAFGSASVGRSPSRVAQGAFDSVDRTATRQRTRRPQRLLARPPLNGLAGLREELVIGVSGRQPGDAKSATRCGSHVRHSAAGGRARVRPSCRVRRYGRAAACRYGGFRPARRGEPQRPMERLPASPPA